MSNLPTDIVIPRGSVLSRIEEAYGPLEEEVRCVLEGCRTLHKRGFIVSFSHPSLSKVDNLAIVGHVCGKARFGGAIWMKAEQLYEEKLRDIEAQAAKERFIIRAGRILPELRAALPRLRWQLTVRAILFDAGREMAHLCVKAIENHRGRLKIGDVTLHRIKGTRFWADSEPLHRAIDLEILATRFLMYLDSSKTTKKEINRQLELLKNIEERWQLAQMAMADADEAIRPGQLQKVFSACNQIIMSEPRLVGMRGWEDWNLQVRVSGNTLEVQYFDSELKASSWHFAAQLGRQNVDNST